MKKKMNLNCKSANRFPGKHMLGLIVLLFGSCIFMNITLCVLAFLCQQYDCAICSATLDTKHCRKYTFICCVLLYSFFSGAAVYFLFRVLISGCHYTLFSFVSTHLKHLVYMKRTFLVQCWSGTRRRPNRVVEGTWSAESNFQHHLILLPRKT